MKAILKTGCGCTRMIDVPDDLPQYIDVALSAQNFGGPIRYIRDSSDERIKAASRRFKLVSILDPYLLANHEPGTVVLYKEV